MSPTVRDRSAARPARRRGAATQSEAKSRGGVGAPAILAILIVIVAAVDQSCGIAESAAPARVPQTVVGSWISRDPRYAGRSIQVDPTLVVIRRGDDASAEVGVVTDVDTWREGAQDVIRVSYRTRDGDLAIDMLPQDTGGMRLRHPREVLWVRR